MVLFLNFNYFLKDKKEKAKDTMQQVLGQHSYKQVLNNCVSTLDPKLRLGALKYSTHTHNYVAECLIDDYMCVCA